YHPLLFNLPAHPRSTLFPYTTLFRSAFGHLSEAEQDVLDERLAVERVKQRLARFDVEEQLRLRRVKLVAIEAEDVADVKTRQALDRKSTRLNSSHDQISYAVFCLKKK